MPAKTDFIGSALLSEKMRCNALARKVRSLVQEVDLQENFDSCLATIKLKVSFVLGFIGSTMLLAPSASGCVWNGFIQDSKAYSESAMAEDVRDCIAAGASPLERDYWGFTPLHWAAGFSRDLATMAVLIGVGANPNLGNRANATPLHFAAKHNKNPKFIEMLIEAGADVNARSTSDRTPLHLASRHNSNASILRILLNAGAGPMVRDLPYDSTPLHLAAAFSENTSVIRLLLPAGADPNAQDGFREASPVHWAARRNSNPSMLEALLDGGADPIVEDSSGESPLNWTLFDNDNPKLAISLIEAGAHISTLSSTPHQSFEHTAARNNENPEKIRTDVFPADHGCWTLQRIGHFVHEF